MKQINNKYYLIAKGVQFWYLLLHSISKNCVSQIQILVNPQLMYNLI